MMKFIKLTFASNRPFFVRPEMIISFGPALTALSSCANSVWKVLEFPNHSAWIRLHGDQNEIYVMETCEEISHLLEEI